MYDSLIFHTQQTTRRDDEVLFSSRRKYFFIAIEVFFVAREICHYVCSSFGLEGERGIKVQRDSTFIQINSILVVMYGKAMYFCAVI